MTKPAAMIAVMAVYSARFPMLLSDEECRRCALEVDNQDDAGDGDARFSGAQEEKAGPAHQASGRSTPDGILSLRKKIRFVCCHGLPRSPDPQIGPDRVTTFCSLELP